MAELGTSGFSQFDRLVAVVRRTRELLDAVAADGALPAGGADFLADADTAAPRGHPGRVPRLAPGRRRGPGRDALPRRPAGLDPGRRVRRHLAGRWSVIAGRRPDRRHGARGDGRAGCAPRAASLRRPEPWHLAALGHARLVLAFLPRLPDDEVRFPAGRRTYADIPVPRGPAELSERIDELERELWLTAVGHPAPRTDPAFRRTYGFFDAAERFGTMGRLAG